LKGSLRGRGVEAHPGFQWVRGFAVEVSREAP
jgi:hypothetical protein